MNGKRSIAAVGDVKSPHTWSGTPFYFWQAASQNGFAAESWRVDLSRIHWQRYAWNVCQALRGGTGGFQYSDWFLDLLEQQISEVQMATEVITFHQHFPRAKSVRKAGGTLNHYLDAPFVALASGRGLDLHLPARMVRDACERERANYVASRRVITMARWAADVAIAECGVPAEKVFTILPGANLNLPSDWRFSSPKGRPGKERDFVLGFVGKDWRRKGLPLLMEVRDNLARRGWRAVVHAARPKSEALEPREGLHFSGFIDKRENATGFLDFLAGCDVGCLFSKQEALGISTLEFLRAGVPVAGFAHEGPADTLPPDAGFRFPTSATATDIAECFDAYLRDESGQVKFRTSARHWSSLVTWERCVREFRELWAVGEVTDPVRPWLGFNAPAA